jgi:hypothetical protein
MVIIIDLRLRLKVVKYGMMEEHMKNLLHDSTHPSFFNNNKKKIWMLSKLPCTLNMYTSLP